MLHINNKIIESILALIIFLFPIPFFILAFYFYNTSYVDNIDNLWMIANYTWVILNAYLATIYIYHDFKDSNHQTSLYRKVFAGISLLILFMAIIFISTIASVLDG